MADEMYKLAWQMRSEGAGWKVVAEGWAARWTSRNGWWPSMKAIRTNELREIIRALRYLTTTRRRVPNTRQGRGIQ